MDEDLRDRLDEAYFISQIMVGDCPRCGSSNTHDCTARTLEPHPLYPNKTTWTGSDCPVSMILDDPTVGHCDDCDYLWCTECGSPLTLESPDCPHWRVCESCGRTMEFPEYCPFEEEAELGELIEDPCLLGCPYIEKCTRCPYTMDVTECPKIQELVIKQERNKGA